MLSFAAPPAPVPARGPDFPLGSDPAHGGVASQLSAPGALQHSTYWPCELLNAFVLQMARAGHCVNTDMMLGHRPYAQQQLDLARGSHEAALQALAQRLQRYFDASAPEACKVAAALDSEEAARGGPLLV